uniref:Fumarate lyase N-terminal domain-containing protein n=1 Tax=Panagrolaimus davidi TaxID=227884 RepID=A0A914Q3U7_9BILA
MTTKEDFYEYPLTHRYCRGSKITAIFSERNKAETWRQLWIWLAEAENELGLKQVTKEAIEEMKANKTNINFADIAEEEKRLKHGVMAHYHSYGKLCPKACDIINLGATSSYVLDNTDLICQKEALKYIAERVAICLKRLADFAEKHAATVIVDRTHYQAASIVTIGKRAAVWAQELFMVFQDIEDVYRKLRFLGIKGATGTQDSFMTLFDEDEEKVEKLDELVTSKAGFDKKFFIIEQTYSRQQDTKLIFSLSNLASVVKKIAHDIRIFQSYDEIRELFEAEQIGRYAMPYERNSMKNERICGLSTSLMSQITVAITILSNQGLEGTLDDSAPIRSMIPDFFLLVETILTTLQNVFDGLTVQTDTVKKNVARELPFLALEEAFMRLSNCGCDRQQVHAKIREISTNASKRIENGENVSIEEMLKDRVFDSIRDQVLQTASNPINFAGRCESQVQRFLKDELYPVIQKCLSTDSSDDISLMHQSTKRSRSSRELGFHESFLNYLKKNADPRTLLKLMQVSKYFCFKEFPFIVIKDLEYDYDLIIDWKYRPLQSVSKMQPFDFDNTAKKLWITETLSIGHCEDTTFASSFISRVAVCDATTLKFAYQRICENELKFFNADKVEKVDFWGTMITDSNGKILPVENVLQLLPNVSYFHYCFDDDGIDFTSESIMSFIAYLKDSRITEFKLSMIPETFDFDAFFKFMHENPKKRYNLIFSSVSDEYTQKLQTAVDYFIENCLTIESSVLIEFEFQTDESYYALERTWK